MMPLLRLDLQKTRAGKGQKEDMYTNKLIERYGFNLDLAILALVTEFGSKIAEPISLKEALTRPDVDEWKKTIDNELESLKMNNTWTVFKLSPIQKAVGCKWVFELKHNPDGSIARDKTRLVAKSSSEVYGVDYFDTFSLVVKIMSIKVIQSLVYFMILRPSS